MDGETLKFTTEAAWGPCNETFDLVLRNSRSLCYYCQTEEPGMVSTRLTTAKAGIFPRQIPCREYILKNEYYSEYFTNREAMFKWLERNLQATRNLRKQMWSASWSNGGRRRTGKPYCGCGRGNEVVELKSRTTCENLSLEEYGFIGTSARLCPTFRSIQKSDFLSMRCGSFRHVYNCMSTRTSGI